MAARVLVDPGDLFVDRPRHHVEGDGRARHFDVVDGADRLGVASFDHPQRDVAHRAGR
jgi:hypothetical protein